VELVIFFCLFGDGAVYLRRVDYFFDYDMQTKIIRFVAVIFIACLVIAGVYAAWSYGTGQSGPSTWSAVYLDTGDLYFGRLSSFPSLVLSNAWYVQHTPQGDLSVNDFSKASWKPQGTIRINSRHVVWTARIASDSPLISAMVAGSLPGGGSSVESGINPVQLVPDVHQGTASSGPLAPGPAH